MSERYEKWRARHYPEPTPQPQPEAITPAPNPPAKPTGAEALLASMKALLRARGMEPVESSHPRQSAKVELN